MISARQQFIFNTLALGLILTWTRINVFRCIAYCNSFSHSFYHLFLNCIQGDPATMHMKKLPMFTYNLRMGNCLHPYTPYQLLCPVINIAMSNNFKHSHVHFTHLFSVTKLDLFIQALLLDYILALGKNTRTPRVHLVFI